MTESVPAAAIAERDATDVNPGARISAAAALPWGKGDMLTTRKCEVGADAGKWYAMVINGQAERRAGYCAVGCPGHESSGEALAHHLQYQLDRETDLWLERHVVQHCEICGEPTTLRARLGRNTKLFVLCRQHQSTHSLQKVVERRLAVQAALPVA